MHHSFWQSFFPFMEQSESGILCGLYLIPDTVPFQSVRFFHSSSSWCCGQFYMKHVQALLLSNWDHLLESIYYHLMIPQTVTHSLIWWANSRSISRGKLLIMALVVRTFMDACVTDWGAQMAIHTYPGNGMPQKDRWKWTVWNSELSGKTIWCLVKLIGNSRRWDSCTMIVYINWDWGRIHGLMDLLLWKLIYWNKIIPCVIFQL